MTTTIDIDNLITIVSNGGKVTTGINVYSKTGVLLLDKDILVTNADILKTIKKNGVDEIPLSMDGRSGLWDADGNSIPNGKNKGYSMAGSSRAADEAGAASYPGTALSGIEKKLNEIEEKKKIADENYKAAKACVKKAFSEVKESGGRFDVEDVHSQVSRLTEFITLMSNPFSYLTREIVSCDDYLYNHSINVCTIGTTVIHKFNTSFSAMINNFINANSAAHPMSDDSNEKTDSYHHYQLDELEHISCGYFLHDIGKVLVPDNILNKSGKLTKKEFDQVKKHSFELGLELLEKNNISNPFISGTVKYHHGPLYSGEERSYPDERSYEEIPLYVKICKLADIYDAMTSKRSYKEAFNQINVVTDIFRSYAKKDPVLQHILHAFIKSIGIYPAGSIVFLRNGQMAYVLESEGPIVIPFTDNQGNSQTKKYDPISLESDEVDSSLQIDKRKSVKQPLEVYELLPPYLKTKPAEAVAG